MFQELNENIQFYSLIFSLWYNARFCLILEHRSSLGWIALNLGVLNFYGFILLIFYSWLIVICIHFCWRNKIKEILIKVELITLFARCLKECGMGNWLENLIQVRIIMNCLKFLFHINFLFKNLFFFVNITL